MWIQNLVFTVLQVLNDWFIKLSPFVSTFQSSDWEFESPWAPMTVAFQWIADVVLDTEPRCSDYQWILRMLDRGMIHTCLEVVGGSCKTTSIHHNTWNTLHPENTGNIFLVRAPLARLTMSAVFFREVATQHDVIDDDRLTSKLTAVIDWLEWLIRIVMRQQKLKKDF